MHKFNVSVRGMLVKSDFISKFVVKSEATNSKTSLANEKESFIVYSIFVSSLSSWSQNLASPMERCLLDVLKTCLNDE